MINDGISRLNRMGRYMGNAPEDVRPLVRRDMGLMAECIRYLGWALR